MDYIKKIFERHNLQNICRFLRTGAEYIENDAKPYMERLKKAQNIACGTLRSLVKDEEEYEVVSEKIFDYVSENEEIYMEIGVRCGFILALQILGYKQTD